MSQNSPDEVIFVDSSSGEKVELTFILYLTKIYRFGGKRILVWASLWFGSLTPLYVFDARTVNLQRYKNDVFEAYVQLF
ncbi:hypothetical protein TNCV_2552281 [Trichonephila clavipes]|nr:hypothetical protein TNCV_2552281 [Trichonephila clavipes]